MRRRSFWARDTAFDGVELVGVEHARGRIGLDAFSVGPG